MKTGKQDTIISLDLKNTQIRGLLKLPFVHSHFFKNEEFKFSFNII